MYDYPAGKSDWLAMGMPTEGAARAETIQHRVRKEIPTCELDKKLADVKTGIAGLGNICVVIDRNRIVLGLLDLDGVPDDQTTVEDVMKPAPPTLRPSVSVDEALSYFEGSSQTFALVTKSTGELIGLIDKTDLG